MSQAPAQQTPSAGTPAAQAPPSDCTDFSVARGDRTIPATLWRGRAEPGSRHLPALILFQHGGPLHKRHPLSDGLAREIVARTGAAVLLIDGPIHGERRSEQLDVPEMLETFKRYWHDDAGIDDMVADWRAAVDHVLASGSADSTRVAWFGLSMGTAYGIPVCAADDRIRAAAFGMWGTDWGQAERLVEDARRMTASVFFQIKTRDEFFSTEGQRALFDALGSPDKRLATLEGGHTVSTPGQLDQLLDFLVSATCHAAGSADVRDALTIPIVNPDDVSREGR